MSIVQLIFMRSLKSVIEATTKQKRYIMYMPSWKVYFMLRTGFMNEAAIPKEVISSIVTAVLQPSGTSPLIKNAVPKMAADSKKRKRKAF